MDTYSALIQRYFPRSQWANAYRVMMAESRGDPNAHATKGEDSRGLFQINVAPGAHPDLADQDLFDPETNVRMAAQIYDASGWGPWTAAQTPGVIQEGVAAPARGPGDDQPPPETGPLQDAPQLDAIIKIKGSPASVRLVSKDVETDVYDPYSKKYVKSTGPNPSPSYEYSWPDGTNLIVTGSKETGYTFDGTALKALQTGATGTSHPYGFDTPSPNAQWIMVTDPNTGEMRQVANPNYRPPESTQTPTSISKYWATMQDIEASLGAGLMDAETANRLMDLARQNLTAEMRGTTIYDEEQAKVSNEQKRRDLAAQAISQKLSSSTSLGSSLVSSAFGLAQNTMMPKGKTSMNLNPLDWASQYVGQQGGDQLTALAQALLAGASGGGGSPGGAAGGAMSEEAYAELMRRVNAMGQQPAAGPQPTLQPYQGPPGQGVP